MPRLPAPDPADETTDAAELLREVRRVVGRGLRLSADALGGGWRTVFRGAGVELHHVREWVEGDDPRTIDPAVSARTGRPFVRTYVDERELTVLFLTDLSASTTGGFGVRSVRATSARVVATLALCATRAEDRVGLLAFGPSILRHVPARKGVAHVHRIVREILATRTVAGGTDLAAPLERVAKTVRRRAVVFLVSDFLAPLPSRALAVAARRHDVVAVRITPPEASLPKLGLARLEDPETGRTTLVDTSSPRVRAAFGARVATHRARTDAALAAAGAETIDVGIPAVPGADDGIARAIRAFFRRRELRSEKA